MPQVLMFRPKERPPEITVEQWEVDLVYDLLAFFQDHGIQIGFNAAIAYAQAITNGQETIAVDF